MGYVGVSFRDLMWPHLDTANCVGWSGLKPHELPKVFYPEKELDTSWYIEEFVCVWGEGGGGRRGWGGGTMTDKLVEIRISSTSSSSSVWKHWERRSQRWQLSSSIPQYLCTCRHLGQVISGTCSVGLLRIITLCKERLHNFVSNT